MSAGKFAKRKLSQLFGLASGLAVFGASNAVIGTGFLAVRESLNASPGTGIGSALVTGLCTAALVALTVPLSKKFGRMASARLDAKLNPVSSEAVKTPEASSGPQGSPIAPPPVSPSPPA